MNSFFVVTPLGFEERVSEEIERAWPFLLSKEGRPHSAPCPEIERHRGGLEFKAEAFAGIQLNFFLKSANRILLRIDQFKARDFPKLHDRLKRLDLSAWLPEGPLRLEVSASKSRLAHEGRILQTALQAWNREEGSEGSLRVYLRIFEDTCDVSLDTSGEHLHRRGLQTLRGDAPLRENIAAFCLKELMGKTSEQEISQISLVDPVCGSGTFLIEAAHLWTPNFSRSYAFQKFRKLPKLFQQKEFAKNYRLPESPRFQNLIGFDLDPKMVQVAAKNAGELPGFRCEVGDVFQSKRPPSMTGPVWMILNPPYGERLQELRMDNLLRSLEASWKPQKIGILMTEAMRARLKNRPQKEIRLLNGGLACVFCVWDSISSPSKPV